MPLNTDPSVQNLAKALRGEAAAKMQLEARQSDMAEARRLQQTPGGGNNIFDALSGNMDRQRGREMMNEVQPRLKKAREQAAQTYGAERLYEAQQNVETTQYERKQARLKKALDARNRQEKLAREDAETARLQGNVEAGREAFKGRGETWVNPDTNDKINVYSTAQGPVDSQGNRVNTKGYVKASSIEAPELEPETSLSDKNAAIMRGLSASERADADKYINRRKGVDRASNIAQKFTPEDVKALNEVKNRVGKQAAEGITPQAFEAILEGEMSTMTPRVKQFYNQLRAGDMQLRHEFFGSALTEPELRYSGGVMASTPGLSLDDVMLRLHGLNERNNYELGTFSNTRGVNFDLGEYEGLSKYRTQRRKNLAEQALGNPKAKLTPQQQEGLELIRDNPDHPLAEELNFKLWKEGVLNGY